MIQNALLKVEKQIENLIDSDTNLSSSHTSNSKQAGTYRFMPEEDPNRKANCSDNDMNQQDIQFPQDGYPATDHRNQLRDCESDSFYKVWA